MNNKLVNWFRETWSYRWIAIFLTWFGDIRLSFVRPKIKGKHIRQLLRTAKKGDVVLRGFNSYLDGHFIPGRYTHSGICIEKGKVMHMLAEGKLTTDLLDFAKDADRIALLSPSAAKYNAELAAHTAVVSEAKYDFLFMNGADDGFAYCHEFTAECMAAAGVNIDEDGLILAGDLIEVSDVILELP